MKVTRRWFGRSIVGGTGIATLGVRALTPRPAEAQLVYGQGDWRAAEFDKVVKSTARIRQVFDVKAINEGGFLAAVKNSFNGFRFGFGVAADQIRIVAALHGPANLLNFDDSMWAKYKLGEYLKLDDPKTGKPALRNPFFAKQAGGSTDVNDHGSIFQDSSIEALQGRGLQMLSCHNSTEAQVRAMLPQFSPKANAEEIVLDLQAHMLPGCIAVPAMVAAISLLQSDGHYTYLAG